jgi:hypothetical protein
MPVGLCWIKDGRSNPGIVLIRHENGRVEEIPGRQYIEQGYQPPLEQLRPCPIPRNFNAKRPQG